MQASDLDRILRRIGQVFIAGLVLQPRVDGRAVLLPLTAAAMVWALWGIKPIAASPEAQRAWLATVGSTGAAVVLGAVGLVAEPGAISVLVVLAFVVGVISYTSLLSLWSVRAGWADADRHLGRVRTNLYAVVAVVVLGIALVLALGTQVDPNGPDPDWWNVYFDKVVSTWAVAGFGFAVFVLWVGAATELERASKAIRGALRADAATTVTPA